MPIAAGYSTAHIKSDVYEMLKRYAAELTGRNGRTVTISEALETALTAAHEMEQSEFAFLADDIKVG